MAGEAAFQYLSGKLAEEASLTPFAATEAKTKAHAELIWAPAPADLLVQKEEEEEGTKKASLWSALSMARPLNPKQLALMDQQELQSPTLLALQDGVACDGDAGLQDPSFNAQSTMLKQQGQNSQLSETEDQKQGNMAQRFQEQKDQNPSYEAHSTTQQAQTDMKQQGHNSQLSSETEDQKQGKMAQKRFQERKDQNPSYV